MKLHEIKDFKGGWWIGNFFPTLLDTKDFEIAVKKYNKGDKERKHVHKIAKEFTVVCYGIIKMNQICYFPGTIIELEPGEEADFEACTNAMTTVVKTPSVIGDKYYA